MEMAAEELLQAQALLWNYGLSFHKSMSLKCALELGIADVLHKHGRPITLAELVATLSIPSAQAGNLRRLMRLLTCSGLFATQSDGTEELYLLTPTSRLLVKEGSTCLSPFFQLIIDPVMVDPSHVLGHSIKEGALSPFHSFHNKGLFDMTAENPKFNSLFNEGMASDTQLVIEVILKGRSDLFSGVKSLVDVGGGIGTMALAIAEAFPQMKCTVFDLPHVIATIPKSTVVDFVGGNMFEHIPKADAIIMKWILHDWSDEECINILKRCKEAIPSNGGGGKVILIEMVVGITAGNLASLETQLLFDLEMLSVTTGKERDESEWQKIFSAAGFYDYKIIPFGLMSIIELYP